MVKHSAQYKEPLNSNEGINYKSYLTQMPGVYEGIQASIVNNTTVSLGTGILIVEADNAKVSTKVEIESSENVTVSSLKPYVICKFSYQQNISNAPVFTNKDESELLDTDVIITKCVYSGATLVGFDYSTRSYGNLKDEFIAIDPVSVSAFIYLMPSTNFWYISNDAVPNIKYANVRIKNKYVNNTGATNGTYYLVASLSGGNVVYDKILATVSNTPQYSFTRMGWYLSGADIIYKVIAQYDWNGSSSTVTAIFDSDFSYESRSVTFGATGIENAPSDYRTPTQKAIYTYLENKGVGDFSTAKNLSSSVNWDVLLNTNLYNISGTGQTNAPDGTTNGEWSLIINNKGNASVLTQIATRISTNATYSRTYNGSSFSIWKPFSGSKPTSIIVAASNSSLSARLSADYVCDGTNDDVEIQQAIDYLATGGGYGIFGEVILLEGTYNINTNILIKSGVNLKGQGRGTILIRASGSLIQIIKVNSNIINFKISDLTLDGNGTTYSLANSYNIYCVDYTNTDSSYQNIYSINNSAGSGSNQNVYGFFKCINLINCSHSSDLNDTNSSISGFEQCYFLTNCYASIKCHAYSYGFKSCIDLSNCEAFTWATALGVGTSSGFISCKNISSSKSTSQSPGSSGVAYSYDDCYYINSCYGYSKNSLVGYAYRNCYYLSSCSGESNNNSASYTFVSCKNITICNDIGSTNAGFLSCLNCWNNSSYSTTKYSSSYASSSVNATYLCADTLNGGWNR